MRKFIHPNTGDTLTFSEWVSWQIQGVIRNWWFIGAWTALTGVWWARPLWFNDPTRLWWNFIASYLAIGIELIVGISVINQTTRDARILRDTLRTVVAILTLEERELEHLEDVLEDISEHHQED